MSTPLTPFLQLLKMGIIIPTTQAVNETTQVRVHTWHTFWHRIDTQCLLMFPSGILSLVPTSPLAHISP